MIFVSVEINVQTEMLSNGLACDKTVYPSSYFVAQKWCLPCFLGVMNLNTFKTLVLHKESMSVMNFNADTPLNEKLLQICPLLMGENLGFVYNYQFSICIHKIIICWFLLSSIR